MSENLKVLECYGTELKLIVPAGWEIETLEVEVIGEAGDSRIIIDQDLDGFGETGRYEITERKPDYVAMVKKQQFGKNEDGEFGFLIRYLPTQPCPFRIKFYGKASAIFDCAKFIPCEEPREIDPFKWSAK